MEFRLNKPKCTYLRAIALSPVELLFYHRDGAVEYYLFDAVASLRTLGARALNLFSDAQNKLSCAAFRTLLQSYELPPELIELCEKERKLPE